MAPSELAALVHDGASADTDPDDDSATELVDRCQRIACRVAGLHLRSEHWTIA